MRPRHSYLFWGADLNRFTNRSIVFYNCGICVVGMDVLFYGFDLSKLSAIS
jgi:hypothetical protein